MTVLANQSPAIDTLFGALGDATRRSVFELLTLGAYSVGELAQQVPVSRSAVSQHLKVLKDAGLVCEARNGQQRIYAVSADAHASLAHLSTYALALGKQTAAVTPDRANTAPAVQPATARVNWAALSDDADPAVIRLIARMFILGERMQRLFESAAAEHRLNVGEAMILGTLKRLGHPYACTPTQLGELSLISLSGIAKRLNHLEAIGLIERVTDEQDRRSVQVRLVTKGLEVFQSISRAQFSCNYAIFFKLSPTQRRQLGEAIQILLTEMPN